MTTITFKVDNELKKEATELYQSMGLDLSTALRLFLTQSINTRSIPFKIEAAPLTSIIEDAKEGKNMSQTFDNVASLMESLNAED